MKGPGNGRPKIPNSVDAKQSSVYSSTKDCQTILPRALGHKGVFVLKSGSVCG